MLQKLKLFAVSFSGLIMLAVPAVMAPAIVMADTAPGCDNTTGIENPACPQGNENDKINNLIRTIINFLTVTVGVVAVIMIIIGGFKYVSSGGSQDKVTSAKNTILYALIGLVIVALAQLIAHFVLSKATDATNSG